MPVTKLIGGGAEALINTGASWYATSKNKKAVQNAANTQAAATERSAEAQTAAENAAIEQQRQQQALATGSLQPYADFGKSNLTALQRIITPEGQAEYASASNPLFQAALANLNSQTLNNAAVRGRLGSGDTKQNFLQNWQAAAMPLLQNQQNLLFNAAGIGQQAGTGLANLYSGYGATAANQQEKLGGILAGKEEALGNIRSNQTLAEQAAKNKFYADAVASHSKFADNFHAFGG